MQAAKSMVQPLARMFDQSAFDDDASDVSHSTSEKSEKSGNTTELGMEEPKIKFAIFETSLVNCSRIAVIAMFLGSGAMTSYYTYWVLRDEEESDFKSTYSLFASNIINITAQHVADLERAVNLISDLVTADAIRRNETFPFKTMEQYEVYAENARNFSGLEMMIFTPIVEATEFQGWIQYSVDNQGWLDESRRIALAREPQEEDVLRPRGPVFITGDITANIWQRTTGDAVIPASNPPYAPVWMTSPPPFSPGIVNYNLLSENQFQRFFDVIRQTRTHWISEVFDVSRLGSTALNIEQHNEWHFRFVDESANRGGEVNLDNFDGFSHPHSMIYVPVFKEPGNRRSEIGGFIHGMIPWDYYFTNLLPAKGFGVTAVLKNTCSDEFTYELKGAGAIFRGSGDLHEVQKNFDQMREDIDLFTQETRESLSSQVCQYTVQLYPNSLLEDEWITNDPLFLALGVAATWIGLAFLFYLYDRMGRQRTEKMAIAAERSTKIVSSLFPTAVRDRLLAEEKEAEKREVEGTQTRLRNFLATDNADANDLETDDIMFKTKPIADLFPETTILFADIAGFTAWSSAREPSQVFTLLETVYRAFDELATRRRVFKVETVGDCYVAATGLPEPRNDHAVAMARFARDCLWKMQSLTRRLEVTLGPDTADLAMRMGMHSGPVTAGVLRGERSRFQLFGDTMNTASRMESTGIRDKIQVSQETRDLLCTAGKTGWVAARADKVVAKGKGEMQTFWLDTSLKTTNRKTSAGNSTEGFTGDLSESEDDGVAEEEVREVTEKPTASAKIARLIDWNVDVLLRLLKAIVARRQAYGNVGTNEPLNEDFSRSDGATVLDEVVERITLPEFDPSIARKQVAPEKVGLTQEAESQLYEYVSALASMYKDNPFHNFEHASHVTMSVSKLLSRIVAPSDLDFQNSASKTQTLHDHTYGITSDPLTQFSCVLSALIHDVDHTGVPNTQLSVENKRLATFYKGRSVAEQNSVDVAWDLLMDECYVDLRRTIYTTEEELKRFRQLVVNSVMATDIMDKELKALRNARWDRAFSEGAVEDPRGTVNRKATIVIEHLIQASDVSHTMQHWHIYRKWNARLFEELYKAYKEGRAEKDPSGGWYKGELGFFDFYIIPLAKKLKDCGVFGVSSDEYLNYAERNRKEWEARGAEVVSEYLENMKGTYGIPPPPPPPMESAIGSSTPRGLERKK